MDHEIERVTKFHVARCESSPARAIHFRMSTALRDYDYELPPELIAQRPLERRDQSRMLVLRRDKQTIEHRGFRELPQFIRDDDLLVLNNTRVMPARHFSEDGSIEFLVLENMGGRRWKCLVRPGRKMQLNDTASVRGTRLQVAEILPTGERIVVASDETNLFEGGAMPLPPYVRRSADVLDDERYQTVFAEEAGAIAAPTAGLHFTSEMLRKMPHAFITLHVGPGTFRPVRVAEITAHRMHTERFAVAQDAAAKISAAARVIAVGTTVVRVLEALAPNGIRASEGETDIFIHPPFRFRAVDALLTNFHLPRSTLLMLVSAFAGRELVLRAYEEAVRERYRFFSYGDCMLIL